MLLISKLDRLKKDLNETQYYILRLEKEGAIEKIPFFKIKLRTLADSIHFLEQKHLH
jgi:hypothetical protein